MKEKERNSKKRYYMYIETYEKAYLEGMADIIDSLYNLLELATKGGWNEKEINGIRMANQSALMKFNEKKREVDEVREANK